MEAAFQPTRSYDVASVPVDELEDGGRREAGVVVEDVVALPPDGYAAA